MHVKKTFCPIKYKVLYKYNEIIFHLVVYLYDSKAGEMIDY